MLRFGAHSVDGSTAFDMPLSIRARANRRSWMWLSAWWKATACYQGADSVANAAAPPDRQRGTVARPTARAQGGNVEFALP
jgi:hypothetical protein